MGLGDLYIPTPGGGVSSVNGESGVVVLTATDVSAVPVTQKGAANGVATLDAGSKIPSAQIPAIALSEFLGSVASEAAMLALTGQRGDWAVRTDLTPNRVFILESDDPTQLANWTDITTAGAVLSVNGQTGAVSLDAGDLTVNDTGLAVVEATNVQDAIGDLDAAVDGKASAADLPAAGTHYVSVDRGGQGKVAPSANWTGAVTVDLSLGSVFPRTLTGNVTSISITNVPAAGRDATITLDLLQDATGGRGVTWDIKVGGVSKTVGYENGAAPIIGSDPNDPTTIQLRTTDGGENWTVYGGSPILSAVLASEYADDSHSNSTAKNELTTLTLPGGSVSAGDVIYISAWGTLVQNGVTSTTFKIGVLDVAGVEKFDPSASGAFGQNAATRTWQVEFYMVVESATALRLVFKKFISGNLTNDSAITTNGGVWHGTKKITVDSLASTRDFVISAVMNQAQTGTSITLEGSSLEVKKLAA